MNTSALLKCLTPLILFVAACGESEQEPDPCTERVAQARGSRPRLDWRIPSCSLCDPELGALTSARSLVFPDTKTQRIALVRHVIRNTGRLPLRIDTLMLTDTTHFKLIEASMIDITYGEDTSCIGGIGAGESSDVIVEFAPQSPGVHKTTLLIESNDPNRTEFKIEISGEGLPKD